MFSIKIIKTKNGHRGYYKHQDWSGFVSTGIDRLNDNDARLDAAKAAYDICLQSYPTDYITRQTLYRAIRAHEGGE